MLYFSEGFSTEKFAVLAALLIKCSALLCLVNSYAYTNPDGVISHKYLLVFMKHDKTQVFKNKLLTSPVHSEQLWGRPCLLFNGTAVPYLGLKRPGREDNHSHLSAFGEKYDWSYTSTPHTR
jgi:hypothetical protein